MPSDSPTGGEAATAPTRVGVYICTFRRNDPLARMLDSLEVSARQAEPGVELGVVVIDDNPDGAAKVVVDASTRDFPLGLHYRHVGSGNIAAARNAGLEEAIKLGDWVAMVDDDQIVVPEWLEQMVDTQQRTGADAVTAPVYPRFPEDAPAFLTEQRFSELWGTPLKDDGAPVTDLQTANSMIRTSFLVEHPDVRFSHDLGKAGGEDMVFYRSALDAGLKGHYSRHAINWEYYEGDRASWRYQLRRSLWHGNTMAVTELRAGRAGRGRLVARALKRGATTLLVDPANRMRDGQSPRLRYAITESLIGVGLLMGAAGFRLDHQ
ncbi:MAG: glycosyltransferase family 2 protein [Actinomycetota bacterium]